MHKLILASQSPRRRDLLVQAGFEFRIHPVEVSEILEKNLNPVTAARSLAEKKSVAAGSDLKYLKSQGFLVLTADTLVEVGGRVLGKPGSLEEASEFLDLLSGKTHRVITALSLLDLDQDLRRTEHEITEVEFLPLDAKTIAEYLESGEALDKAGAYGIQGHAGRFIKALRGPRDNVIGLPVGLFKKILVENGWQLG